MAKNKYYAVRKGRVPGIYRTWSECQKQVTGYPGAVFKGFVTEEEAQSFLHPGQSAKAKETHISHTAYPYAYVDGSYFQGIYGFGGFLKLSDEEEVVLQRFCIWMQRIVENFIFICHLHNISKIHNCHTITDVLYN